MLDSGLNFDMDLIPSFIWDPTTGLNALEIFTFVCLFHFGLHAKKVEDLPSIKELSQMYHISEEELRENFRSLLQKLSKIENIYTNQVLNILNFYLRYF